MRQKSLNFRRRDISLNFIGPIKKGHKHFVF